MERHWSSFLEESERKALGIDEALSNSSLPQLPRINGVVDVHNDANLKLLATPCNEKWT